MSTRDKARLLFEIYLRDCDEYEGGWKELLFDLSSVAIEDPTLFSDDAFDGIGYMCEVAMHMVCKKCGDKKGFEWLDAYAKGWLAGNSELPLWPASCMNNEEEVRIIN